MAPSASNFHSVNEPLMAEHFLPLRATDLAALLAQQPERQAGDQGRLASLFKLLSATIHHEYHERLQTLKDAYAPYDPDGETRLLATSPAAAPERLSALFADFGRLLQSANFRRLEQHEMEAALEERSEWGLNLQVDFALFERLDLYVRGACVGQRWRSSWRTLWRSQEGKLPVYQRLVLIFRLHAAEQFVAGTTDAKRRKALAEKLDTDDVHIKLFKDIPRADLEMLLPGARVKMSGFDRTKIILPTLSGLAMTAWKIVKGALVAAAVGSGVYALLGLIGGTLTYGAKSFYGYLRTKEKYQLSLAQSLYYQNLDNNAGVLHRLTDEAEEQDLREALLAYFWLVRSPHALTARQLDERVEEFLRRAADCQANFEVDDALQRLVRFGLVEREVDGRFTALAYDAAVAKLDETWDSWFTPAQPVVLKPTSASSSLRPAA